METARQASKEVDLCVLCKFSLWGRFQMRRVTACAAAMALILCFSMEVAAGGARSAGRPDSRGSGAQGTVAPRGSRSGNVAFGHPHRSYYYPYGYHPPVRVISPYQNYSYYLPRTVVVNSPFFCVLHQVGFVGRAGMIDHLAGTHKFLLETAASLCPDGADNCIFPSY